MFISLGWGTSKDTIPIPSDSKPHQEDTTASSGSTKSGRVANVANVARSSWSDSGQSPQRSCHSANSLFKFNYCCYNMLQLYIYIYSNSLQNCYKFGTLSHILARSRSLLMSRFWTIPDSMWNVAPSWMLQVSEEAWPDFSSMLRAIISDFWSFRFLFHIITDHHI